MNLYQRIIIGLGCNALLWILIHPPLYQILPDGSRHEHTLEYLWNAPVEWSVNVPLSALRVATVVLITIGFAFVFRSNPQPEVRR